MFGSIIGDTCGSVYEFQKWKTNTPENIDLLNHPFTGSSFFFTDDSVLTFAVAETLLTGKGYQETIFRWANTYPDTGFGGMFYRRWVLEKKPLPYNSFGNGSAMRVSPVGWAFATLEETLEAAEQSAVVSHNHPEGIKGAQAAAAAMFLARSRKSKDEIRDYITENLGYDLNRTTAEIRPDYHFEETCQKSVPEAIICFLESTDFVNTVQLAISLGGDTDTIACIAGGIAEAFYGTKSIPQDLRDLVRSKLTDEMRNMLDKFYERFVK